MLPGRSAIHSGCSLRFWSLCFLSMIACQRVAAVNTPPSHPTVEAFRVIDGKDAVVRCHSEGIPPPAVTWQFANGSSVNTGDGRRRAVGGELHFRPFWTSADYPAIYKCMARNPLAATSSDHTPEIGQIPKITRNPEDITVEQGKTGVLLCAANASPTPHYRWYKTAPTGQPIAKGHALHIESAQYEDHGLYFCQASNWAGTALTRARVTVLYSPVILTNQTEPVHLDSADDRQVLIAVCEYSANPAPTVRWFKNSMPLAMGDHFRASSNATTATLHGQRLQSEDGGLFSCVATNPFGSASESYRVMVKGRPPPPNITDLRITAHSVDVFWQVMGDGNSPIEEYTIQVTRGDSATVIAEKTVKSKQLQGTLHANGLLSGMYYRARVLARNKFGQSPPGEAQFRTQPTRPYRPNITDITSHRLRSLTVHIHIPHNGGEDVRNCSVDYRRMPSSGLFKGDDQVEQAGRPMWRSVQVESWEADREITGEIKDIMVDAVYEVRARCSNKHGWSRWSPLQTGYSPATDPASRSEEAVAGKPSSTKTIIYAAAGVGGALVILLLVVLLIVYKRRRLRSDSTQVTPRSSHGNGGGKPFPDSPESATARYHLSSAVAPSAEAFDAGSNPGGADHSPTGRHFRREGQLKLQRLGSSRSTSFSEGLHNLSRQQSQSRSRAATGDNGRSPYDHESLTAARSSSPGPAAAAAAAAEEDPETVYLQERQRRQYAMSRSLGYLDRNGSFYLSASQLVNNEGGGEGEYGAMPTEDPVRLGCYGAESPRATRSGRQPLDDPPSRRFPRSREDPENLSGRASILHASKQKALERFSSDEHASIPREVKNKSLPRHAEAPGSKPPIAHRPAVRSKTLPSKKPPHLADPDSPESGASGSFKADISQGVLDLRRPRRTVTKQVSYSEDLPTAARPPLAIQVMKLPSSEYAQSTKLKAGTAPDRRAHPRKTGQDDAHLPSRGSRSKHSPERRRKPSGDGHAFADEPLSSELPLGNDVNFFNTAACISSSNSSSSTSSRTNINTIHTSSGGGGNALRTVNERGPSTRRKADTVHAMISGRNVPPSALSKKISNGSHRSRAGNEEYEVDDACIVDGVEYPPTEERIENGNVTSLNSYV